MTSRAAGWWAWSLGGVCVVLAVVGSVLNVIGDPTLNDFDYDVSFHVVFLVFAALGVVRRAASTGEPIGWLLLVSGLLWELAGVFAGYANYSLFAEPGSLSGGTDAAWVLSWLWIPTLGIVPFLFVLFPDGRLRSGPSRLIAGLTAVAVVLTLVGRALRRARWRTLLGSRIRTGRPLRAERWRSQRPPEMFWSPWR